jgi:hypothetical protein
VIELSYVGIGVVAALVVLAIWKADWLKSAFIYIARDEMPIWLSLALAAFAAIGTYYLAPVINQDLEFQKNRSAHIMTTVKTVNDDFVQLTTHVRQFNEELFYQTRKLGSARGVLLDEISELQWRMIDVGVIIRRSGAKDECVSDLKTALEHLRSSVVEARKPEDQESVIDAYQGAATRAESCINVLYSSAKLS